MRAPACSRTISLVNLTPSHQRDVVDRHGRVVILVEDDAGLRGALERVLRAAGFEAQSYTSAEAALADHRLEWADCLVVDLNLPAMSGLDLVDRVRQHGVSVPTVLITAHDEPHVRDEVRRHGIQHFLAKPFLGSALLRLLDNVIAGTGKDAPAGTR